jgi:hypothetical protein
LLRHSHQPLFFLLFPPFFRRTRHGNQSQPLTSFGASGRLGAAGGGGREARRKNNIWHVAPFFSMGHVPSCDMHHVLQRSPFSTTLGVPLAAFYPNPQYDYRFWPSAYILSYCTSRPRIKECRVATK